MENKVKSGGTDLLVKAGLISFILMMIILTIQLFVPKVLEVPVGWIFIISIPLIIALLIGGHISSVKGPGFEVVANLKGAYLGVSDLDSEFQFEEAPAEMRKGATVNLRHMGQARKSGIKRLRFLQGSDDYIIGGVYDHLAHLPIEYYEIVNGEGELEYMISRHELLKKGTPFLDIESELIEELIRSLRHGRITKFMSDYVIKDRVHSNSSKFEVLKAFARTKSEFLPIVDLENRPAGVVKKSQLLDRISQDLLKSNEG